MRRISGLFFCFALVLSVAGAVVATGEPVVVANADGILIDGDLSDWSGNPVTYLSSKWVADAVDVADDADLSAFGMFSYDTNYLYAAFRVIDDAVIMEQTGTNVWQTDCVEFWINGKHFGLTLANGEEPIGKDSEWKALC